MPTVASPLKRRHRNVSLNSRRAWPCTLGVTIPRSNQHDVDPELTKRFDQGAGSDIASASAPYIPVERRYELKQAHDSDIRSVRADDSVSCVLVPPSCSR